MIRSKIIPILAAAFCGLAAQFQASAANAQTAWIYTSTQMNQGYVNCSGIGNCLEVQQDGNIVLYNLYGNALWATATNTIYGDYLFFQGDGNLVVYSAGPVAGDPNSIPGGCLVFQTCPAVWASGTNGPADGGSTVTGLPGAYLGIQDDGNLVIFDINFSPLWSAAQQSNYNWSAQSQIPQ
jgi:hypothetical protein